MLTLTRRPGERVYITTPGGETIIVEMGRITGKRARVRFRAPEGFEITREELLDETKGAAE